MGDSLSIARKITPPAWMNGPDASAIFKALAGEDGGAGVLFVGGCVRNAVLEIEVEDVDMATIHAPEEVSRRLEKAGFKVIPTGIDHGTVSAVTDKRVYEITTLRKDVETDGRHAVVAFSADWREDAARRDFTMNTLLADREGNIFDPLGQGLADLEARSVRFVGDPAARIAEDYLRILRFFRFHALYGKGAPDKAALGACKAAADKITTLSRERITQEFFKIMSVYNPVDILVDMIDNNILSGFIPFDCNLDLLRHLSGFQKRYKLQALASRLFAFAGLDKDSVKAMQTYLLFPKVFLKDIQAMEGILALPDLSNEHAVKVAIYKYGRSMSAQALMIELANDRVMNGYAPQALKIIQNWDVPDFPLGGDDLIKAGYKPGPDLGQKLSALEERWIESGFTEKRESLLADAL